VQRELLTRYHVDNPLEFYGNVSFWDVPSDPTVPGGGGAGGAPQPPYYILAGEPGAGGQQNNTPTFQLTSALVFRNRDILSAYVTASSDPANYGKITVLQLPPDTQTLGPQQVQTQFVGSPEVSQDLGLLSRGGQSTVEYGNLLTLPVAGGLLFVEPVYIERANQQSSYPQLARVLVSYNGRVGYDANLSVALDQVFGAGAGAAVAPPAGGAPPAAQQGATPGMPAAPAANPQVAAAAASIQSAINQLRAANQSGDFAAQGQALQALDSAVQQFQQAQAKAGSAAPSAPPAAPPPPGPGG
jgi:hypothetical protein